MITITIRLIGESDERLIELDVQKKILRYDLQKKIEAVTHIPTQFQKIQLRGEDLPVVEQPIRNMKFGEELHVKHSELPLWEQYKSHVIIALRPGHERQRNAIFAVEIHKLLSESNFFSVYWSYNVFRVENHHKIMSYSDGNIQMMKEATRSHFLRQHYENGAHDETTFTCRFEARPDELGGSRKNTLAFIQLYGQKKETKYNIK
ncbi:unnamed protein product [Auanema sp. JU1783]|nr:unnamed protein product [Auanema sp. JU1783]